MKPQTQKALELLYDLVEKIAKNGDSKPCDISYNEVQKYAKENGVDQFFDLVSIYKKMGGFTRIRDAKYPPVSTETKEVRRQLQKKANENRRDSNTAVDVKLTLEGIEKYAGTVFSGKITPVNVLIKKSPETKRYIHALWSDLHYGSDIYADETGVINYGAREEARRTAKFVSEIVSYKPQYRAHTKLKLLLNGDLFQNQLHDPRDGDFTARQVCRTIHLLSQVIAHCAASFPAGVEVECQTGNHGRNTGRHPNRAIHQKVDSWETVIYYSLMKTSKHLKNVRFNIPKTPFSVYNAFGKFFMTHGDTVFRPGNPGNSVDVKGLSHQIDRINAALPDSNEYVAFVYGHTHEGIAKPLSNGAWIIGNGCMVPPDDYAVSLGIFESQTGQWIWEGVEGHPVGDLRYVNFDSSTDKDSSLDKIIKPWTGFNE